MFAKWFTKIVKQPENSIVHNSVLQSVSECLETHQGLVADASRLLYGVFTTENLNLGKLPALLKVAYDDDIFMLYETMNTILGDLK